jgi:hypothetical protein
MVLPGHTITLQYDTLPGEELLVPYVVCNADGTPAIARGLAVIASAD